jgi:hypothetical protein
VCIWILLIGGAAATSMLNGCSGNGFFAQALVGDAAGFNSVFPYPTGATTTARSLAFKTDGGVNVALTPHVALRALEADWTRTQLPNSTTNAEDNFNLGAGLVFRFR